MNSKVLVVKCVFVIMMNTKIFFIKVSQLIQLFKCYIFIQLFNLLLFSKKDISIYMKYWMSRHLAI